MSDLTDVPVLIGSLAAFRVATCPFVNRRRSNSVLIIEIETGRDYRISGPTEWFEIDGGVVFETSGTAVVAWAEGIVTLGAGTWLVRSR